MLSARVPLAGLYRVEVSGWDTNDAFFVEKSDLEWSEETGNRVVLCNAVLDGEVVFLRLLPSLGAEQPQPTLRGRVRRSHAKRPSGNSGYIRSIRALPTTVPSTSSCV
jgi:hypothetical protein